MGRDTDSVPVSIQSEGKQEDSCLKQVCTQEPGGLQQGCYGLPFREVTYQQADQHLQFTTDPMAREILQFTVEPMAREVLQFTMEPIHDGHFKQKRVTILCPSAKLGSKKQKMRKNRCFCL